MAYDFRAQQVRLNRIISSGSIPIIIYASSSATNLQGGINFSTSSVGSDVFLYVSGSSTSRTLFGGTVVVSGALSASQITGSLQFITPNVPYLLAGSNVTISTSSIGQVTISSTGGGGGSTTTGADVSASYVVISTTSSLPNERAIAAGNGIRLTDGGAGGSLTISNPIWTEQNSTLVSTTSSVAIKSTTIPSGVDLFISGSDTSGNGANLVLYSNLAGYGLPRLILSSSSGSLGGLLGYDDDVSGLVDGVNIDIPTSRNFGFRIGGSTAATTIDAAGNLNVRSGSNSTAYFDTYNRIVGLGITPPSLASTYTNATRLVLKDTDNTGTKYQLLISNEYAGTNINSGIAFAFGNSNISGAIYAKSNDYTTERKGLNVYLPSGTVFSWRNNSSHLGQLDSSGNLTLSGSVSSIGGFTGSLSGTIAGKPFIIAGPYITASYNSLGQWEITGSTSTSTSNNYFFNNSGTIVESSGSLYISGSFRSTTLSASSGGQITGSLNVNGTISASSNISTAGNILVLNAIQTTGSIYSSNTISASVGIFTRLTGTLSGTTAGLPFVKSGPYITASYNSVGQWEITGSFTNPGGSDTQIQFNSGSTFSGSSNLTYNYSSNTLNLTGSASTTALTTSYIKANSIDITPITASLTVLGDGSNLGSGSVSGLFNLSSGQLGKYEIEVIAIPSGNGTGAAWKYSVSAINPSGGSFSFIGANELTADYGSISGSINPSQWDVNFNDAGKIEFTGSNSSSGTYFYAQITKKMIGTFGSIIF